MKIRSAAVGLIGLAFNFALPTFAQQKDLADPETTQKILALTKEYGEAFNNNDRATIAALYTRDAVLVTTVGPIIGRQAIQKYYTELYQWWHPKNLIIKVDGDAPHLIGTAGNELWATGEWIDTGQGKNGEPLPIKGHWAHIYVREGDGWKIRVDVWNQTLDSVILINKSFAPQSAATPSPIAGPGTLPTYAQQRDLADSQTTQKVFAHSKEVIEARNNHDAAAVAALAYARDAVFLTPDGPIIGREAIQKWYTDMYQLDPGSLGQTEHQVRHPGNLIIKVDGDAPHLIGTAGNEFWATGEWSDTGEGKNGETIPIKGYWADIFVREGDDWKSRLDAWNVTPDSVILINKSFAPQPSATPSSTASPSGQ
jgi:uncharacterized protein (TIGR02246 family)